MKILFSNFVPFSLAHGGAQIQIEQTWKGLETIGIQVEPLRWWDDTQTGEVLHHFGRMPTTLVRLAHQKGLKVVTTDLLTAQGSRSKQRLFFQCGLMRLVEWFVPGSLRMPFNWESYRMIDGIVTNTQFEADLVRSFYRTDPKRIHVIPNGVEEAFFKSTPVPRGDWLVCTATITPRKRVLELAEAAVLARTPIRFLGKAYGAADDYNLRFLKIVKDHPDLLRYEGSLSDRNELAKIYRSARGFVLLSAMETRSLSSEEAAACECPLLLSDLPWARDVFRETATYSNIARSTQESAADLRKFYDSSSKPVPPRPLTWVDVAKAYANVYKGTLATS